MYAEIQAAIASARLLGDIILASKDLRNFNELAAAVSEVNGKLMQATGVALASQEKQAALADRVRELEAQIARLESWDSTARNYTLKAVGTQKRDFAYIYTPTDGSNRERHWACPRCFQERKLYLLTSHNDFHWRCPNCGTVISPEVGGGHPASIASAYEP